MGSAQVEYIDTSGLQETASKFNLGIADFNECVREMGSITETLYASWDGEGRDQFETQYVLMKSKLDDITETLYDIYNVLIESETAYIDVDESVAKEISASAAMGDGGSGSGGSR